jgi:hypothetical protein
MSAELAGKTREIIRLWNSMRAQERAGTSAEVFALRKQLQHALADRDQLVQKNRQHAKAS